MYVDLRITVVVGGYGLPLLTFLHVSLGSPLAGAGEVGLSFSLSVLWLFWGRGAEWLSCHSIVWSGWWGCYTGEFWSWSCSQGTAALAQRAHQGRVMSWAPPHIQPASQVGQILYHGATWEALSVPQIIFNSIPSPLCASHQIFL